jgi:hypothetical protein
MSGVTHIAVWLIEESNEIAQSMRDKMDEEEEALRLVAHAKRAVRAAKKKAAAVDDDDMMTPQQHAEAIAAAEAQYAAAEAAFVIKGEEYAVLFNDCVVKGEELHAAAEAAGTTMKRVCECYYGEDAPPPRRRVV